MRRNRGLIRRASDPCAFTLVELLVVIGVIAVLISLLLPALARARRSAQEVTCSSNLRQIGLAMVLYEQEFKRFPARDNTGNGNIRPTWVLEVLFYRYVRTQNVFICPSNTANHRPATVSASWVVPADMPAENWVYLTNANQQSYGFNFRAIGHDPKGVRTKLLDFRNATETIMFADSQELREMPSGNYVISTPPYWERVGTRHRGGCNMVFMDGHVQWGKRSYADPSGNDSLRWKWFFPLLANNPLNAVAP